MWYLQEMMDAAVRQTLLRWLIIFLIGLLVGFFVACDTPYSNRFLGQGIAVEDIQDNLHLYVEPGECVSDGFDWVCREVHTHHVILEVDREVKVPEPYPVIYRELYIVQVKPNEVVETPVGIISIDSEGTVIDAPKDVVVIPIKIDEQGTVTPIVPIAPSVPRVPRQPEQPEPEPPVKQPTPEEPRPEAEPEPEPEIEVEPEVEAESPVEPPVEPEVEPEPPVVEPEPVEEPPVYTPPPRPRGEYIVYTERVNGNLQSGVIHSDYVKIDRNTKMITFTGADGEVDGDDNESTKPYVKIETGLTYEQASKRAPQILIE